MQPEAEPTPGPSVLPPTPGEADDQKKQAFLHEHDTAASVSKPTATNNDVHMRK